MKQVHLFFEQYLDSEGSLLNNQSTATVECWDIFDLALHTQVEGNPFLEVQFSALFTQGEDTVEAAGFYDGTDVFRLHFMPQRTGEWRYETRSNLPSLNGMQGSFTCIEPSQDNHGPVKVADTYHFQYADGTRYLPIGTTCYAWLHQPEALQRQTLDSLSSSPFNKLRMCIFPKYYEYNRDDPALYPFEHDAQGGWDFTRFNPHFFRHLEQRLRDLRDLGIEADLILFHPYDNGRWGFDQMGAEADDRYLRYVLARLSAYRNVWWSLANEWDLCKGKTVENWDRFFQIVQHNDPYGHLRSIHNCYTHYDHTQPWVTHASVQTLNNYPDLEKVADWCAAYQKPVVVDETGYEGNLPFRWGFHTPQEMVHRFWMGTALGGYVGHGETYLHPQDILWWSKGGALHGQSPARIAFLRAILEAMPPGGLNPAEITRDLYCVGQPDRCYLAYGGRGQPGEARLTLPEGKRYSVDVIDAWEMTITRLEGTLTGQCRVSLPSKPYIALRLQQMD
ncbi:MAG: DUF5060 domain-containing protein [Chloroflexi bacterium]|nr:DUF5060 domain-containing protein [Chloroflexota bacterium]